MSDLKKNTSCQMGCWAMAAIAGFLTFVMLLTLSGKGFMAAVVLGVLVFVLLGLLFNWLFCAPLPASGSATTTGAAPTSATSAASSSTEAAAASSSTAAAAVSTAAAASAETEQAVSTKSDDAPAGKATPKKADSADAKAAPKKATAKKAATADAKATSAKTVDKKAASDTVAAEKKAADKKAKAAKAKADKAAAKAAADAQAGEDYDGDGVREGADEGSKPELLTSARAGGADDLKRIKGIGPKLEGVCNSIGVYHFDQIAEWSAEEIAWVNANLIGFKGRVSRDDWVAQAKLLAAGEETEFSKRVDKGSVY